MPSPLPRAGALIRDTWNDFLKTWDNTARYSVWLIPAGVLQSLYLFIPRQDPATVAAVGILGFIASLFIGFWAGIALYLTVFKQQKNEAVHPMGVTETLPFFWPTIHIGILGSLFMLVVVIIPAILLMFLLGGVGMFTGAFTDASVTERFLVVATAFLIPVVLGACAAAYFSTRLNFATALFFDKAIRGKAALMASWELTKKRFWPIFGRQLLAGLILGLVAIVTSIVSMMIVGVFAGGSLNTALDTKSPIGEAASMIISSIVQAAILPAAFIFQIKLYLAVEKTKA